MIKIIDRYIKDWHIEAFCAAVTGVLCFVALAGAIGSLFLIINLFGRY